MLLYELLSLLVSLSLLSGWELDILHNCQLLYLQYLLLDTILLFLFFFILLIFYFFLIFLFFTVIIITFLNASLTSSLLLKLLTIW